MAALEPFEPAVKTGAAGFTVVTVVVTTTPAISGSINSAGAMNPSILVTNFGANISYVRLSVETSTAAGTTVSTTDTPMLGNTVRLFANPSPSGVAAVAVFATVGGNTVFFTPGEGGI
jgi:hypothetical protein